MIAQTKWRAEGTLVLDERGLIMAIVCHLEEPHSRSAAARRAEQIALLWDMARALQDLATWWGNWMPDEASAQGGQEALAEAQRLLRAVGVDETDLAPLKP